MLVKKKKKSTITTNQIVGKLLYVKAVLVMYNNTSSKKNSDTAVSKGIISKLGKFHDNNQISSFPASYRLKLTSVVLLFCLCCESVFN